MPAMPATRSCPPQFARRPLAAALVLVAAVVGVAAPVAAQEPPPGGADVEVVPADGGASPPGARLQTVEDTPLETVGGLVAELTPDGTTPAAEATGWTISTPIDRFGLSSRLVLSTMNHAVTASQLFTIQNTMGAPLHVQRLVKGGDAPGQFAFRAGQPTSFTVPAFGSAQVGVKLRSTYYGNKFATLDVVTDRGTRRVLLRGVDHRRPDFSGGTEPSLQALVQVFGFKVNTGVYGPNQATTSGLIGDEVRAPYFTRLDPSKPVVMVPLARYVAPTTAGSISGSTPLNSATQRREYRFPADVVDDPATPGDETVFVENQKVLPRFSGSSALAVGPSAFGLHANYDHYADDRFNRNPSTGAVYHNLRIYPARDSSGVRIPGAYLVGVDIKVDPSKNYDYQDQLIFLSNAKPL